jgi:hypothetical protein
MPKTAAMNEQEAELDAALCNFCNQVGDPFEPASQWNDYVWMAFGRLSKAYNEWYKTKL